MLALADEGKFDELDFSNLKSPFEYFALDFKLEALFNQSAKINGKWYQKGDFIYQKIQLVEISQDSIWLDEEGEKLRLDLKRINHKVFID